MRSYPSKGLWKKWRTSVAKITRGEQEWFWSEDWQAGEREAEADLAVGRVREFENAEEAIRFLKKYCPGEDESADGAGPGKEQV
jgi:hypothetical protein